MSTTIKFWWYLCVSGYHGQDGTCQLVFLVLQWMLPSVVQGQVHVPCPKSQVHKPDFNLLFPLHLFEFTSLYVQHNTAAVLAVGMQCFKYSLLFKGLDF